MKRGGRGRGREGGGVTRDELAGRIPGMSSNSVRPGEKEEERARCGTM